MKGLLIKDLKLLKNQRQFFLMIFVMAAFFLMTDFDVTFLIMYLSIMVSMFTLSTISYDEFDNGAPFLFTLPISRRGYAKEKYIFGMLTTAVVWAAISIVTFVVKNVRGEESTASEFFGIAVIYLMIVFIMMSVTIPLQLKFGAEKSRLALIAVAFLVGLVVMLAIKFGDGKMDMTAWMSVARRIGDFGMLLIIAGITVAAVVISSGISVKIMEKKEY